MKSQRLTQFEKQKDEILKLYSELECEPNSTFERSMICGLQEEIILSIKTMNAIEKILATLQVLKFTIQPRRICNRQISTSQISRIGLECIVILGRIRC